MSLGTLLSLMVHVYVPDTLDAGVLNLSILTGEDDLRLS